MHLPALLLLTREAVWELGAQPGLGTVDSWTAAQVRLTLRTSVFQALAPAPREGWDWYVDHAGIGDVCW